MDDWRTWNLRQWNERLLDHFFRCSTEPSFSVVVLLVTAEELARATGQPSASADEVRDGFVGAVRTGISSGSLLEDATDYYGWPGPPNFGKPPRFVAHLLFTCVAASESSDELGDETKFIARLRALSDNRLPDHSLEWLPRLWENLAVWLEENDGRYRRLRLPDPGGFTRIGYTIRLAFPDRRDQKLLSELLDRAGLSGHEPPVNRVLSLVASEKGRFRSSFCDAFEDFRKTFQSGPQARGTLTTHRFWAAVREAALRGRGRVEMADLPIRVSLLGEEQGDEVFLFVASATATETESFSCAELPVAYGEWHYVVVPRGVDVIHTDHLDEIATKILSGVLRLPRITSVAEQGVLPFVIGSHGLLELATYEQLSEARIVLVEKSLLTDFLRSFGGSATAARSVHLGWAEVRGAKLHPLPTEQLDGTGLSRVWILHENFVPTVVRLSGGIRADDGWLGVREVLPRVIAPGALSVALSGPGGREYLVKLAGGDWEFPQRDLVGSFRLEAEFRNGTSDRRTVRFFVAPSTEDFKVPSDPDAWIMEGLGGTGTLSGPAYWTTDPSDDDYQQYSDRVAYLGANVGEFLRDPEAAVWIVVRFGGKLIGVRGPAWTESAVPTWQVADAHARHRWRKLLFDGRPSFDSGFDAARRQARSRAIARASLPKVESEQAVPDLASTVILPSSAEPTERLVHVLAGRATTRAGFTWHDWVEFVERVLKVKASLVESVTRAWMESGLIDVGSYARWRHRSVFARRPRLVAFRVDGYVGATLIGLTVPTTREELERRVVSTAGLVEERCSASAFVPRSLSLRLRSRERLEELALACGIEVRWLRLESASPEATVRQDGTSAPPSNYEWAHPWPRWSLVPGEHDGIEVEHRMRRGCPDYWVVSGDDGSVWSYDFDVARAWAAALSNAPIVDAVGDTWLVARNAYLPLPLARAVAVLGAGLPGPAADGTYRYPVGSPHLQAYLLDLLTRTFDPSRLSSSAARVG